MENLSGNLCEHRVQAVNSGYSLSLADHNRVLDLTATGGELPVSPPNPATLPNGFRVFLRRNAASDSNVVVGAPISLTLTADSAALEIFAADASYVTWRGPKGDKGDAGDIGPAGPGVADGGSTGQILAKLDSTNQQTGWIDPPSGMGNALLAMRRSWSLC